MSLAVGTPGGGAGIEFASAEFGSAVQAGFASPAVAEQLVLIRAGLAVGVDIVAQRRAAVVETGTERGPHRVHEHVGAFPGEATGGGIDTGGPQGLVGIDVAHSRYRALAEEDGLEMAIALLDEGGEIGSVERVGERFGTECVEGGDTSVIAGDDAVDSAESSELSPSLGS